MSEEICAKLLTVPLHPLLTSWFRFKYYIFFDAENQKTPDTPKCIGSRIADESTIYCATSVAARLFNFDNNNDIIVSLIKELVTTQRVTVFTFHTLEHLQSSN